MKIVTLKKFALARYEDKSPFPLGDLTIKVEGLPKYEAVEIRFVAKMNGAVVAKQLIAEKDNIVTINQELLDCGEFKAAVVVFSKGVKVEEYEIEPLLITAADGDFFADPIIAKLTTTVQDVALENAELREKLITANVNIECLTAQVEQLQNFANACISAIPYINDLKLKEDN